MFQINFGYKNVLKTEWLAGRLPELKHDFYDGSLLKPETLTLEHIRPKSKGGKTTLSNLVLTSFQNNFRRSNKDIRNFINISAAINYLKEAEKIKNPKIDGKKYAKSIKNNLRSQGVNIDEYF